MHSYNLRRSSLARSRRKRELAAGLSVTPTTEKDDIHGQWIFNHALLTRHHYRLEYCKRCTHRYVCDLHAMPIVLLPLLGDWTPLLNYLPVHLIRFEGLSWVETLLFIEKTIEPSLLKDCVHVHNRKALHPMNMCRALWRLVESQRLLLQAAFSSIGEPLTPPLLCDFTFANQTEAQERFVDQLSVAKHCVCDALLGELSRTAGVVVNTRSDEWRAQIGIDRERMVYSFRKRRPTVAIGLKMWRLHAPPGGLMRLLASTDMAPHSRPVVEPTQ